MSNDFPLAHESALDALLQTIADDEASVEAARQQLCGLSEFSPQSAFVSLCGSNDPGDLHFSVLRSWIFDQPRASSCLALELHKFEELMSFCSGSHKQQLDYDGFLRLVLPRGAEAIRNETVARGMGKPWQYDASCGRMPPEVALRFCKLIDAEVSLRSNHRLMRERLQTLGFSARKAYIALQRPAALGRCLSDSQREAVAQRLNDAPKHILTRGPWSLEALEWLSSESQDISLRFEERSITNFPAFFGTVNSDKHQVGRLREKESPPDLRLCTQNAGVKMPEISKAAPKSVASVARQAECAHATPAKRAEGPTKMQRQLPSSISHSPHIRDGTSLRSVLHLAAQLGELDARTEVARTTLPSVFPHLLDVIFNTLDRFKRGFVTETDLWQLTSDMSGPQVEFRHICALVQQTKLLASLAKSNALPSGRDVARVDGDIGYGVSLDSDMQSGQAVHPTAPGRLSLREFVFLVLTQDAPVHRTLRRALSDADARSLLVILRDSTPCPGCGISAQRDGDSRACPHVVCPICGVIFDCIVEANELPLSDKYIAESLAGLRHVLAVAAANANECLHLMQPLHDALCKGSEAGEDKSVGECLRQHANKLRYANQSQLMRSFKQHGLSIPSGQMVFVWRRLQLFAAQYGRIESS